MSASDVETGKLLGRITLLAFLGRHWNALALVTNSTVIRPYSYRDAPALPVRHQNHCLRQSICQVVQMSSKRSQVDR